MEVLAPAGGWEALEAAVRAGADAVYLGGQAFGARASAKNFSREELKAAVEYCHARGVRVHVTVNTLLKDHELDSALDFVQFLCALPVDAVLVQDMGLWRLLRQRAPALPLHASTQMSLHTPAGVRLVKELGGSRAVLARELALDEIREIADSCSIELEAFVHGALCMSVSGQCYLSAMLGGRSGNRGQCAQPCRLPFAGPGGTGHDLSLKDLSFMEQISRLRESGVCSAKIEGRMKRPEYVAAAAAACRLAADGEAIPPELARSLEAAFSRSGFTDGYLTGRRGRSMFGTRRKEDVTAATEKVYASLRNLYRGERQSVPTALCLSQEGGFLVLTAQDQEGRVASARTPAEGSRLPRERCLQQLGKTGGTPFRTASVQVPEEGAPIGVAGLNALRRQVLGELLAARTQRLAIPFTPIPLTWDQPEPPAQPLGMRAVFRSAKQLCPQARACEAIALPVETGLGLLKNLRQEGWPQLVLDLPRAIFGGEKELRRRMEACMAAGFGDFLCGNLGAVQLCRELGARAHGSFGLNIANSAAAEVFCQLGLASAELSFELSNRELARLRPPPGMALGLMVYGRQPLMLTRNCPLANGPGGCQNCREPGALADRKGARFPVVCRSRGQYGVELLNSVPLWLGDLRESLPPWAFGILRFTVEDAEHCGQILQGFQSAAPLGGPFTRGLIRTGVK